MSRLTLELHEGRTRYHPGEAITGIVGWEFDRPPELIEVRLYWRTSGKGTTDRGLAATHALRAEAAVNAEVFELRAPDGPLSYDGTLIAIGWRVQAIAHVPGWDKTQELTVTLGAGKGRDE